ncbi:hypothetical protein J2127_001607 [Methanococcus voltae]|uniref:DUF531 domain-containing protein n=1 Tax=Methanococcus voltae TaxID=2188 RepID=UPI001AEA4058|nr:DUF531 domain-containing protein [Methanococcus voltae]MBP2144424.1 hypothetical protein [Methanococcus voltae]
MEEYNYEYDYKKYANNKNRSGNKDKHYKRCTMILYNSYDKSKWHEAHKRAIARAAPICTAFDWNLAIYDFPVDKIENLEGLESTNTEKDVIKLIETTIGGSGSYLRNLIDNNRFIVTNKYQAQFGTPIATTSKPDAKKLITPKQVLQELQKKPCGVFIGLGRHGLPKDVMKMGHYELDITEKGLSLETCTAIASIPSVLGTMAKYE